MMPRPTRGQPLIAGFRSNAGPPPKGYPIDPADVVRLTPLGRPTTNLDGRYRATNRPPATGLRPLRIN
jgi:hypothetical protein